jgi:integrase
VAVINRNNGWSLTWRLEGKQKWLATKCRTKTEAQRLERECLAALDAKNFSFITEDARHILVRLHKMMGWATPDELLQTQQAQGMSTGNGNGIVLWNKEEPEKGAIQRYFADPVTRQKSPSTLGRNSQCFHHLIRILRANTPVKDIWVSEIREYYAKRIGEGASPNTVGWELSSLSAVFGVLMADRTTGITENPCQLVRGKGKGLKFDSTVRQPYLSWNTVNFIISAFNKKLKRHVCPEWLRSIILTSYYSGMRLGEILGLKRDQVFLDKRMIFLTGMDTKEAKPKAVPIHHDLVPLLERLLPVRSPEHDHVFLLNDRRGLRPVTKYCVELAMRRIYKVLNPDPRWRFHDLRHTFKANCARSGVEDRISERILGHSDGYLAVNRRYGEISEGELIQAIDKLKVDNGETRIDKRPVALKPKTPIVLKPVSYLLAKTKKRDAVKIGVPLSS